MTAIVEISAVETTVQCDEKGNAEQKVTVHNISGRELRVGARILVDPPAKNEWVGPIIRSDQKDKKETEWDLAENDTIQLTVPIKAAGAAEGNYGFRVEVFSTAAPGEEYVTGNTLAFKVPAKKAEPPAKEKGKFPMWIIFVILGVLLVVGGGVAAWLLLGGDKVPDLAGKSLAEAETALQESDLKLGNVTKQVTGDNPVDTVISQDPPADTKIEEGLDTVDLVIEAEPEPETEPEPEAVLIPVPQLVSMSFEVAESTLLGDNLKLGNVTEQITGNHPIGTVLEQTPEAKTKVEKDSAVNIVIEAVSVVVPDLKDKFSAEAQEMLTMANLVLDDEITQKRTGKHKGGVILEQTPPAGERVRPETVVSITVEKEKIPVPSVIGQTQVAASKILSDEGFRLGRVTVRRTGGTPGVVLSQDPSANRQMAPGTAIALVVEEQKITVPQLRGKTQEVAVNTLKKMGLQPGSVSNKVTGRQKAGTIVSQTPNAGAKVSPGTKVNLVMEFKPIIIPPIKVLPMKPLATKDINILKKNLQFTRGISPEE